MGQGLRQSIIAGRWGLRRSWVCMSAGRREGPVSLNPNLRVRFGGRGGPRVTRAVLLSKVSGRVHFVSWFPGERNISTETKNCLSACVSPMVFCLVCVFVFGLFTIGIRPPIFHSPMVGRNGCDGPVPHPPKALLRSPSLGRSHIPAFFVGDY